MLTCVYCGQQLSVIDVYHRCDPARRAEYEHLNGRAAEAVTAQQQAPEPLAELAAARARIEALEAALRQARVGFYSIQQVAQGWKVLSFDQRSWALQDIYEGATIDLRLVDELLAK